MTMNRTRFLPVLAVAALATACGPSSGGREEAPADAAEPAADTPTAPAASASADPVELEPGLAMRILKEGQGAEAASGDIAIVHYTGWLYDETQPDNRGTKFDSSRDRDQHFQFPLGAGRVIKGWDSGVVGMKEGELRELTIAPELAYGQRDLDIIPPNSTLVFEVELAKVQSVKPEVDPPPAPNAN